MGTIEKMLNDLTGADEKAQQARERLDLLKNAAVAHLEIAENDIADSLAGKGRGLSGFFIVPDSVQNFQRGYTISTGETVDAGISTAVDQFFSGNVKDGFKTVIKSALSVLFADTQTGEQKKDYYFVTMEHNAFVRVDVSIWKYYFSQKGLTDDLQQAFCYTFVKSIIDHKKVSADTMIYHISEQMNDDMEKIQSFVSSLKDLHKQLESLDPHTVANRAIRLMK